MRRAERLSGGPRVTRWARALAALGMAVSTAQAASLTVRVVDAAGQPAADVAVVVRSAAPMPPTSPMPRVEIRQQELRFVPAIAVVTPGTALRFTNLDEFDHHVRGTGVASFSFRIAAGGAGRASTPGETLIEGGSGPVLLGCHLHSSMRAAVYVSDSPWFGISDAQGQVVIPGVPAGDLKVTLWHAQQLVELPAVPVQVGGPSAVLNTALNFVPRRRR